MSRGFWVLVLLLAAGLRGQEEGAGDEELWLRVTAAAAEVGFGQGFALTVERGFDRGWEPDPWTDEVLAPLELKLVDTERREVGGRVAETRRYRAYLFEVGEVLVPAPWFRARSVEGELRVVFGDDLEFRVTSALDADAAGPVELPGGLMQPPFSLRDHAAWIVALVAVAGLGGWFVRRRMLLRAAARGVETEPAEVSALRRLARLRVVEVDTRDEDRAWFVEASGILRDYVGARLGFDARDRTTEELLAVPEFGRGCAAEPRSEVVAVLARCDLVKFAHGSSDPGERQRVTDAVEDLVRVIAAEGGR